MEHGARNQGGEPFNAVVAATMPPARLTGKSRVMAHSGIHMNGLDGLCASTDAGQVL